MKSFVETVRLDDESLRFLKNLIGITPWRILTPCIQVAGSHFTSPSLSIERGKQAYTAITCAWFEAPFTFTDYWRLSIVETTNPVGVGITAEGAFDGPCTINLYGAAPISFIDVYCRRWEWSDKGLEERTEWDFALLFQMQEDRHFCIWCQLDGPGIATELSYTENQNLIDNALENAVLRTRIG